MDLTDMEEMIYCCELYR